MEINSRVVQDNGTDKWLSAAFLQSDNGNCRNICFGDTLYSISKEVCFFPLKLSTREKRSELECFIKVFKTLYVDT